MLHLFHSICIVLLAVAMLFAAMPSGTSLASSWNGEEKLVPYGKFPIPITRKSDGGITNVFSLKTGGILRLELASTIQDGATISYSVSCSGANISTHGTFTPFSKLQAADAWVISNVTTPVTVVVTYSHVTVPTSLTLTYEPYFVGFLMLRQKVWVNGYPTDLDVAPYLRSGEAMLPLRYVTESLGAAVSWDAGSRQATISFYGKTMVFTIDSKTITINGLQKTIPVSPQIIGVRTFLPLYVLKNILLVDVDYRKDAGIVELGGHV